MFLSTRHNYCIMFVFFKQKTAYEMRISDWSSDVCSSDLIYRQFHRLPNPDLVMYVFPHLAGTDPVPVPGYSTVFPLYPRVQYAMPGQRVEAYSWHGGFPGLSVPALMTRLRTPVRPMAGRA